MNDQFFVGPTVHTFLIDMLLRFRRHKVGITTDVGKMYRAVQLTEEQRDLHRFLSRDDCTQPLPDYRMTRLTFGVDLNVSVMVSHSTPKILTNSFEKVIRHDGC